MFTGLIKDMGFIQARQMQGSSLVLTLSTGLSVSAFEPGMSIACNGACLTVVDFQPREDGCGTVFNVELGPQTLALTRFAQLPEGTRVNLEPALRVGDSLGGHDVSGHVDGLCEVLAWEETGAGFWRLLIACTRDQRLWLVAKGSVAVMGISLTVAHIHPGTDTARPAFEIMIIPHTRAHTTLSDVRVGDAVEVEFDQKVKTIASLLEVMVPNFLSHIGLPRV